MTTYRKEAFIMSFNLNADLLTPRVRRSFENPVCKDFSGDFLKKYIVTFSRSRGNEKYPRTDFKYFEIFAIDFDQAVQDFYRMVEKRSWKVKLISINKVVQSIREDTL